jgi:hypothetical protein
MNITVIGGSTCSKKHYQVAYELGKLIAREGWTLVCGGREGVMEAACRGAKEAGGLTVGILPSLDASDANDYVDIKIPTGLGYARNILVVRASRFIIAINGKYGTLSELAFAFNDEGRTVLGIDTWDIPGVIKVKTPREAVKKIKDITKKQKYCPQISQPPSLR